MNPPTNPVLDTAYANTAGAVAYLDETFHPGPGDRFYVVTAVLVPRTAMQPLRDELRHLAGGTFWHTTDELMTEDGHKRALAILQHLGAGDELCVITHHTRVDTDDGIDLEKARRDCLRTMATTLSVGAAPLPGPTGILVLEERNPRHRSNFDRSHFNQMRADRSIHRSMQVVLTSPKYEHLLWLPDVVAMAYRRTLTHHDHELFEPIRLKVHITSPPVTNP